MFFILSKTLNYLVMPLTIIAVSLLLSVLITHKKWRRWLRIGALLLLLLFSNEFIANELMQGWEIDGRPYSSMPRYKLGIVLTGAVIPQIQPDDRVYFNKGVDRLIHTVQLYKLGLIEKILISGGSGRLIDINERESDRFKEVMIFMGVPDSVIFLENTTRNTHESAVAVKRILSDFDYASDECVLITSAFHMRRSLACYRRVGLRPDSFTTDFYSHNNPYYFDAFVIPKINALIIWHKLVREWAGFAAYWVAGYI